MNDAFRMFNLILKKTNEQFKGAKKLYVIAFYDMFDFQSITGEISDNLDEIKKIYNEKYAWKKGQIGITEYNYRIIEINLKEVLD